MSDPSVRGGPAHQRILWRFHIWRKLFAPLGSVGLFAVILGLPGCTNESFLRGLLAEALPSQSRVEEIHTCRTWLPPAVAVFRIAPTNPSPWRGGTVAAAKGELNWVRAKSLDQFADAQALFWKGPGAGRTILDGKTCLLDLSEQGEAILFDDNPGYYYASSDQNVVIAIFDEPANTGVIFVRPR